ncbi:MAG TPA: PAS domain-containing protein [Flavisolibacter sp.]|nr:PAS domain-containing protein [Flavisolibacter sp.]
MVDLAKFFDLSYDIFCILDFEYHFKKVNTAFLNLLGYPEQELVAHPFTYYIHPDDRPITQKEYSEVLKGKRNALIENRFRKITGDYCWISWSSIVPDKDHLFYAVGQDITNQKVVQEILREAEAEKQKEITRAVIKAQEKERAQISRELHDNVNQMLTTVKLYNEICRDSSVGMTDLLNKSIVLLQEVINENRNLSKRLSTVIFKNITLQELVVELVEEIAQTNLLLVYLDFSGKEEKRSEDVHLAVYRILQENFTNIFKHAEATQVWVTIKIKEDSISMDIKDNGKGFNTESKRSGIGITNMKMRAEILNGTFILKSARGEGTLLTVHIPYNLPQAS